LFTEIDFFIFSVYRKCEPSGSANFLPALGSIIMIEADSVLSTPPLNSSPIQDASNVIKFPFGVSRRAYARKTRTSKNDTHEERAAKAGLTAAPIEQRLLAAIVHNR
jgi:hypothetical protein